MRRGVHRLWHRLHASEQHMLWHVRVPGSGDDLDWEFEVDNAAGPDFVNRTSTVLRLAAARYVSFQCRCCVGTETNLCDDRSARPAAVSLNARPVK